MIHYVRERSEKERREGKRGKEREKEETKRGEEKAENGVNPK
jgi:hypothetical protein